LGTKSGHCGAQFEYPLRPAKATLDARKPYKSHQMSAVSPKKTSAQSTASNSTGSELEVDAGRSKNRQNRAFQQNSILNTSSAPQCINESDDCGEREEAQDDNSQFQVSIAAKEQ
jgi:hypothetical protein